MNYEKIYNSLIESRMLLKNIRNESEDYFENHHAIPRCLEGSDNKSNIVRLTAREHFIAHAILVKIHPTNKKITNAFIGMKRNKTGYRYINSKIYEQLKKYWKATHSGVNHHLYQKTHSDEAKVKISNAKKGTMPVRDAEGNVFCVDVNDFRVLSGELAHHSKGRKMSSSELRQHRKLRQGVNNPNANPITDKEIVDYAVKFYTENQIWCKKHWIEYCKINKIPISYSKMRFNGCGYNELINKVEEIIGPIKRISKKDYASLISDTLKSKNKKWYHNLELKQSKLLEPHEVNNNWILGRKLKWD